MSVAALDWAKRRATGQTGRKCTLLLLADVCNHHGVSYASLEYLGEVCECHPDTVGNHLRRLEADGHLVRIPRWRSDGKPTSTLTVLAPRAADRGSMLPEGEDPEHGPLIRAHLAKTTNPGSSGRTNPGSSVPGFSETNLGFSPDEPAIHRANRPSNRQLDPSHSARDAGMPELPTDGESVEVLISHLGEISAWCGDQPAPEVRRFAGLWIGDAPNVFRTLSQVDDPEVRLELVTYASRQATGPGWRAKKSIASPMAGKLLDEARERVALRRRGAKSATEQRADHDAWLAEIREDSDAYLDSLQGGETRGHEFDYEAEAVEVDR